MYILSKKEESWGKADVAQASLLVDQLNQPLAIIIISKPISLKEQAEKEMLFTSRRNKTQDRPLTRGKGPGNHATRKIVAVPKMDSARPPITFHHQKSKKANIRKILLLRGIDSNIPQPFD